MDSAQNCARMPRREPCAQLREEEWFFYTQTLKPEYHVLPVKDQIALTYLKVLKTLKSFAEFRMVIEFTKAGVVHYHGYGMIKDPVKYWKTRNTLRDIGFMKFEKTRDIEKVREYCNKDLRVTADKMPLDWSALVYYDTWCSTHTNYMSVKKFITSYLKEKEYIERKEYVPPVAPLQIQFKKMKVGDRMVMYLG